MKEEKPSEDFRQCWPTCQGTPLFETIPRFHDINSRLQTFYDKIKEDPAGRVNTISKEIDMIYERAEKMKIILNLGQEGVIPLQYNS